jgi:hypothetical protein
MIIEVGIKSVPSLLFIILATVRFLSIRDIGFASRITTYSKFYIAKICLQIFMAAFYLILIIIILSLSGQCNQDWFNVYNAQYVSFVYLFDIIAWLYSSRLLRYEYRKRLSEGLYSH